MFANIVYSSCILSKVLGFSLHIEKDFLKTKKNNILT